MRGTIIYQTTKRRNVVRSGDNYRSLPSLRAPFLGLFAPPRNHRRLPSSHRVARKTFTSLFVRSFVRASTCAAHPSIHPSKISIGVSPSLVFRVPAFPREFSKCILTVHDSCRFVPTRKKSKSASRVLSIWRPFPFPFPFGPTDRPTDRSTSLDEKVES